MCVLKKSLAICININLEKEDREMMGGESEKDWRKSINKNNK